MVDYFTERIQGLSPHDLLQLVTKEHNPQLLRSIARIRFAQEASMENGNNSAPFILWQAINKEPHQDWLPVLLAKVVQAEFTQSLSRRIVIVSVPSSATWYTPAIQKQFIFNGARYTTALKEKQFEQFGLSETDAVVVDVPSYVHDRDPVTGARHSQRMFFYNTQVYHGADVVVFDDALAEGITGVTIGRFLRHSLGANRVFYAAPMEKAVQGGRQNLNYSRVIDGISTLITVTQTHGYHGKIDFR